MQTQLEFTTETQKANILKALRRGEKLTALDMLNRFGAMQAATRIFELRAQGHTITSRYIKTPSGKRIVEYSYGMYR
jgi:hypothetical protein